MFVLLIYVKWIQKVLNKLNLSMNHKKKTSKEVKRHYKAQKKTLRFLQLKKNEFEFIKMALKYLRNENKDEIKYYFIYP